MMLTITSCNTYPRVPENLLPLANLLRRRHIGVRFSPWQSHPQTPFILPLCAWDYAEHAQAFADWIRHACGQRFINPPECMLWNMDKRYLIDLSKKGIDVIPSVFLAQPDEKNIQQTLVEHDWQNAVIKPAIGQSGRHVQKISSDKMPSDFSPYRHGVMVQPYIRTIENGEISMVFFNGSFSHAVRRLPPQGEWRANSAYGVEIIPVMPSETWLAAAQKALSVLAFRPVYARVDGTDTGSGFLLNELELIEPALYLHTTAGATERFAEILADICGMR